jgi:hypothetical protein
MPQRKKCATLQTKSKRDPLGKAMIPDQHRKNMIVTIILLTTAVAAALLMGYISGGWAIGALAYVAGSLAPYALLLGLHHKTCANRLGGFSVRETAWSFVGIAIAGPLLYFNLLFFPPDAQGAIAMLMVSIPQFMGIAAISLISLFWYYLQSRKTDSASGNGMAVLSNPILSLLNKSALAAFSIYMLVSALQHSDAKTIDTAKEVDFFINQYCGIHGVPPTSGQLHMRFPGLTTEAGWFFFTDDVTWLKVQYPVKWSNSRALGKSKTSEFTATTYSYILEYHCGDAR